MLPHIGHDWFDAVTHVFLIRDPREVLASYLKSRPHATAEDIGVLQEAGLYEEISGRTGKAPPVIDADEFLKAPEAHLRALCTLLRIPFTPRMALDKLGVPFTYINTQTVAREDNLKSKYDVILFGPIGIDDSGAILNGTPLWGDPIPWKVSAVTPNMTS